MRFVCTIRQTRGDDIDAACGQLAGQVADRTRRAEQWKKSGAATRNFAHTRIILEGKALNTTRPKTIITSAIVLLLSFNRLPIKHTEKRPEKTVAGAYPARRRIYSYR